MYSSKILLVRSIFCALVMPAFLQACGESKSSDRPPSVPSTSSSNSIATSSSGSIPTSSSSSATTSSAGSSSSGSVSAGASANLIDCGQALGGVEGNQLDGAAKSHLLCLHNQTRARVALGEFPALYGNLKVATNMKRLAWDDKLAQVAQGWANQCEWKHNGNREAEYNWLAPTDINGAVINGTESVGENIAYLSSSNLTSANIQQAVAGYKLWEDEGYEYSFGKLSVSDYCEVESCGHFTQLMWATTYKVGCAINFCPKDTLSPYPATYLVCNYASAGNYVNSEPYKTADSIEQVCSQPSPSNQNICKNGLTQSAAYSDGF